MADLLTPEQMRALAEQETLEGFVEQLAETPYSRLSVEAEGDVSEVFERAFYRKFIERMMGIVNLAPTKIGDFLQSYYYLRFEIVNLKRILRGKFSGIPTMQIIESLIPMTPYKVESYEDLTKAETFKETVQRLGDTAYAPLISRLELCEKYDALWPMEIALNHLGAEAVFHSLEHLSRGDRAIVRGIVQAETDIENFLVAVKQRGARDRTHSIEKMFPETYAIGVDRLREAVEAEDIRHVIQGLGQPYSEILAPLYEGDVALIRSRLRQHIYDIARKGRMANDFGFNAVMAYLVFSEIEKYDLVGIAWGKAQGVPPEDILKYLVIPHFT
jgi:V/A-type H+-transporting ATPase subunit C